jgi:tRNA pseudouridine38-40 synthase
MARRIRLVVEYDGSELCGWQRQTNGPSVQGHLEAALAALLQAPTSVTGASRTDAGVHARGQVAAFSTERDIPPVGIRRGLNTLLPPAIAIVDAAEVDPEFHPRYSATGKHYRYQLLVRRDRAPRWETRAWHRPGSLDLAALAEASSALIGAHDFAAFRATGCSAKTTRREVSSITVSGAGEPDLVAIDVRGTAFLRHMVRIMVGTLVEVAEGRFPVAQVAEILASRDRARAGQTAPAHGLELIEVFYEGRPVEPGLAV